MQLTSFQRFKASCEEKLRRLSRKRATTSFKDDDNIPLPPEVPEILAVEIFKNRRTVRCPAKLCDAHLYIPETLSPLNAKFKCGCGKILLDPMYHPARDRNTSASTTTTTFSDFDEFLSQSQKNEDGVSVGEEQGDKEEGKEEKKKENDSTTEKRKEKEKEKGNTRTDHVEENKEAWDSEWIFLCAEEVEGEGGEGGEGGMESPKPFVTIHRSAPGEIWMHEDHFEQSLERNGQNSIQKEETE